MSLNEAIKICRAAGHMVGKPRPRRLKLIRVGPTCVVQFADGEVCRMSTNCSDEQLDYERGTALCIAAWQARRRKAPAKLPLNATGEQVQTRYELIDELINPPNPTPSPSPANFESGLASRGGRQDR